MSLLGQETPGFCYNKLVELWRRGFELNKQGRLTEALAAYDEAIRLGEALDLSVAQYCKALAEVYLNRCVTRGTSGDPAGALADSDRTIELMEGLRTRLEPDGAWPSDCVDVLAKAYMNRGNAKQHAIGHGPGAALADYDAAIALMEALRAELEPAGRWTEALRNALAKAYMNRGDTKQDASGYGPGAALADYDRAIELREGLRAALEPEGRWEMGLRNDLAKAYMNRGNAKQHASGHGPDAALADHDAAIKLREALRAELEPAGRWTEALRNDLAGAYMIRGNAKVYASRHGPGAALADFDAAIKLREALRAELEPAGRWTEALRKDLAKTYANRGLAKQHASGHGPGAAIADYDMAIALWEVLQAELEPESLAGAYLNRGLAKRHASGYGPNAAIADYDVAIDLLRPFLVEPVGSRRPVMVEAASRAFWGKANACLAGHDAPAATDAADEGLRLLKGLEIGGTFWLRSLRESLFEVALDTYIQAQQFQWVPDIIRECLDPDQPGSAPASEAMHAAALKALVQSLVTLYQAPRRAVADTLAELEALARQLAGWRTRYFSGEASSAWLRAQDCEKRGLPEQAEQILHAYIQARPLDPRGHKVLGDWYVQRRQPAEAEAAYRDAARVCARSTPPKDDLHARSINVVTLARCLLDLRLLQLSDAAPAAATAPDPIKILGQGYDRLHTLLTGDFVHDLVNHSPPDLKGLWWERLKPELEALWQRAAAQRDDWLTKHAQGMVQEERDKAFEAVLTLTKGLFQGLGRSWQDCQQAVLCALKEIWDYRTARSDQPDLEELVAAAVREAVERSARALADSELQASYQHLRQTLDPLWDRAFEDREKRFLGCGWRSLQHLEDEDLRRFAGLNLGLAVEWSLGHRLYEPLKAYWSQRGKPDLGAHRLAPQIDRFLTRPNQHLMLGEMVGALNSALKHAHNQPDGLRGLIVACLRQMPDASALLAVDEPTRARRRRQLELINDYRIVCAHPESPPSQEALQTMWNMVVADPEHAFFRYFGAALLPPPDPATPP